VNSGTMNKLIQTMQEVILPVMLCALGAGMMLCLFPDAAFAQVVPPGTCTTDPPFQIPPYTPGEGLVSTIATSIQKILEDVMKTMYLAVIGTSGSAFHTTVSAAVSLYIVIYGILFTFGMVQITVFDFVMRMIKIGFVALLLSPNSWDFFNDEVIYFFNAGTDSIIAEVVGMSVGGVTGDPLHPFAALDNAITKAVSAKMAVTLQATAFTGVYGLVYCFLLLACLGAFVKALLTALWVYLMSLVLRTLLFGLAPIFLVCILFNRTRNLFDGWLNQVVNACLQPILLFIFFAFFAALIEASIDQILYVPVCWTEAAESVRGSPFHMHFWRYSVLNSTHSYEPYGGGWSFTGPQNAPGDPRIFPLDIIAVLVFFMLAQLANRFNSIILMVARELAGATTDLSSMQGALSEWFSNSRKTGEQFMSTVKDSRPGRVPGMGGTMSTGGGRGGSGPSLTGTRTTPGSSPSRPNPPSSSK
jgi:type IV secretory pathway VirB6-like protein